jgi:hypothetical protein
MKLTNQQIISLAEAITHLDGQHVMQVIEGRAVSVFKSYRLAHAARWLLARTQGCLNAAITDFNRAKDALINHYSGGTGQLAPHHADFSKFVADFEKLKQEMVELPLQQITLDQLHLQDNEKAGQEMPIAVLNALRPLIAGECAADDKISATQTPPSALTI